MSILYCTDSGVSRRTVYAAEIAAKGEYRNVATNLREACNSCDAVDFVGDLNDAGNCGECSPSIAPEAAVETTEPVKESPSDRVTRIVAEITEHEDKVRALRSELRQVEDEAAYDKRAAQKAKHMETKCAADIGRSYSRYRFSGCPNAKKPGSDFCGFHKKQDPAIRGW
jgi:hypothetical protein